MSLNALIVDDEEHARALVREFASRHPELEIVGECSNGFEAVKMINDVRPDLVFLDVQMPKLDGFEVLELVEHRPAVVFVTAYDHYALRAFEVRAIDYLLKPFSEERFAEVISRVSSRGGGAPAVQPAELRGGPLQRIVVRNGAQIEVIPVDRLDYIRAEDDYVRLHAGGRGVLKQQNLSELEQMLDPSRFVRIHRSCIVNLERLARVEQIAKDSRVAVLRDGTQLPVSRTGYVRLKELL